MAYQGYSKAQGEANARYIAKAYSRFLVNLRKDEDAEIIEDIEEAKQHGITMREWLSAIFYAKPEIPQGLVPLETVEAVLQAFRVDNAEAILEELKKR